MNITILVLTMLFTSLAFAAGKTYSEEEFVKAVNEEVKKKVEMIKNKSVSELTKEILDKEEKLKLKEMELVKQEDTLKASESELGKKYAELEARQKSFIGCVNKNEDEAKGRVGQLVEMVSSMKPQKAAEVLSVQDPDIAVKILQMIEPKKASKIFNFMEKDVSAKLQKQYLEMKK